LTTVEHGTGRGRKQTQQKSVLPDGVKDRGTTEEERKSRGNSTAEEPFAFNSSPEADDTPKIKFRPKTFLKLLISARE
jgi:hypothetical protein